jgi:hypothetical protein
MLCQWDLNSLWESRNVWLPIEIDDREGSLQVVWHDIYDLNVYACFPLPQPGGFILTNIAEKRENGSPSRGKHISQRTQNSPEVPIFKKP